MVRRKNKPTEADRVFGCPICGLKFTQKSNMKVHAKRKHGQFPGGVTSLPLGFNDKTNLKDIVQSYTCQFCAQAFSTYFNFKSHLSTHNREKIYKCTEPDCTTVFYNVQALLTHAAWHRQTTPIRYPEETETKCKKCHIHFKEKESLQRHLRFESHKHPCPICKKILTCERYLRKHLVEHTELKCTECDKIFGSLKGLREHTYSHEASRFLCEQCGKSFSSKAVLRRHVAIHFEKTLICPYMERYGCEKKFYRQDKLDSHVKSHLPRKEVTNLEILQIREADKMPPLTHVEIIVMGLEQ